MLHQLQVMDIEELDDMSSLVFAQAVERCAQLEKDNEKLKYQAIHLKRAVKESDEAKAAPATS